MKRVLLLASTTGYQTHAFGDAAARLGVELVFATDRCHLLDDPWQDQAIPIRFYDEDASVAAILESAASRPIDGLLVVGDRPTVIAARVAERLGLPWHPPGAADAARHKQRTRECLRAAGLAVPWFVPVSIDLEPSALSHQPLTFPCVLKPVALSGSRGVMRADNGDELTKAWQRLQALMRQPEVRAERNDAHAMALIEGFIPGREYALEGLMQHGALDVLAIFDKPDPLDGPFFEETIYVTPSSESDETQRAIVDAVTQAAQALRLHHGPIHAECRVNPPTGSGQAADVFVLEVAARPIGGLCARALRFVVGSRLSRSDADEREHRDLTPLEELLLRHAIGEDPAPFVREASASGVMMIPIPRSGMLRGVDGIEEARRVDGVDEVHITAKPDQLLVALPEGASYLGFIFARAATPAAVGQALRAAHACLAFKIHYNLLHG
ncbi:MAG: ATP-dependent carboxylate-amine ligase domain protein ATP-grasp [Acidobacteria bacterium]|nr:ATP-dependent carboxylate-amine ligase domain protein ATP-grasp [Acidobacteriota bacterium]